MTHHPTTIRVLRTPRGSFVAAAIRRPDAGEITLSDAEVRHGIQHGLIDVAPLPRAAGLLLTTAQKGGTS